MISVEFDRAKMRRSTIRWLVTFCGAIVLVALAGGLLQSHIPTTGWLSWLSLALTGLVMGQMMVLLEPMTVLGRGLRKKIPAVVINYTGVVDNASQFTFGQIAWDQIERMYPYEMKSHLFTNRWKKMPIILRQRGVAIWLKDGMDLSNAWYRSGKRRWLFIPEIVLPMTAKDLMTQLNAFYIAEVRGY